MSISEEQLSPALEKSAENGEGAPTAIAGENIAPVSDRETAQGDGAQPGTIEPIPEVEKTADRDEERLLAVIIEGNPTPALDKKIEECRAALNEIRIEVSGAEIADEIQKITKAFQLRDSVERWRQQEKHLTPGTLKNLDDLETCLEKRVKEIAKNKELAKKLGAVRKQLYNKPQETPPWWNLISRQEQEKWERWDWLLNWGAWLCLAFAGVFILQDFKLDLTHLNTNEFNLEEMLGTVLQSGAVAGGINALLLRGSSAQPKNEGEEKRKQQGEGTSQNIEDLKKQAKLISQGATNKMDELLDRWNIPRYWQSQVKFLIALAVLLITWSTPYIVSGWGYWGQYKFFGESYLTKGEYKSAESALVKALDLKKDDPDILFALGQTYESLKKPDIALSKYEEASKQKQSPQILNSLAYMKIMSERATTGNWTGQLDRQAKEAEDLLYDALSNLTDDLQQKARDGEIENLPWTEHEFKMQSEINTNFGISSWAKVDLGKPALNEAEKKYLIQALSDFTRGAGFELKDERVRQKGKEVTKDQLEVLDSELNNVSQDKNGRAVCYYRLAHLINLLKVSANTAPAEFKEADAAVGASCYRASGAPIKQLRLYDRALIYNLRRLPGLPKNLTVATPAATPAPAEPDALPAPATAGPAGPETSPTPA